MEKIKIIREIKIEDSFNLETQSSINLLDELLVARD